MASPQAYEDVWGAPQVSFRKSTAFESSAGALAAWLRRGELIAEQATCPPYDKASFVSALREVRKLTVEPASVAMRTIPEICRDHGVVVAFVPELPGSRVSGAAWWPSNDKALIQVSLRYKADDHLWFTFFHEAAHVLRHARKKFLDIDEAQAIVEEEEANQFAADFLIPPDALKEFVDAGDFAEFTVSRFAAKVGIAPGIVVGRLQHDHVIQFHQLNHLKHRFEWNGSVAG